MRCFFSRNAGRREGPTNAKTPGEAPPFVSFVRKKGSEAVSPPSPRALISTVRGPGRRDVSFPVRSTLCGSGGISTRSSVRSKGMYVLCTENRELLLLRTLYGVKLFACRRWQALAKGKKEINIIRRCETRRDDARGRTWYTPDVRSTEYTISPVLRVRCDGMCNVIRIM
jgi:hypothetical protein